MIGWLIFVAFLIVGAFVGLLFYIPMREAAFRRGLSSFKTMYSVMLMGLIGGYLGILVFLVFLLLPLGIPPQSDVIPLLPLFFLVDAIGSVVLSTVFVLHVRSLPPLTMNQIDPKIEGILQDILDEIK